MHYLEKGPRPLAAQAEWLSAENRRTATTMPQLPFSVLEAAQHSTAQNPFNIISPRHFEMVYLWYTD